MAVKQQTIALLGGTGACGKAFCEKVLSSSNHKIRLLARTPSKISTKNSNLEVIEGDGTSFDDVDKLIKGCDMVVSCAGNSDKLLIMNKLVSNVITSCKNHNVSRFYCITSLGLGGSSFIVKFFCMWR